MHTASGLVYRVGRQLGESALLAIIASIVALALILAAVAWIADLLQPRPEVVIMAPFRW